MKAKPMKAKSPQRNLRITVAGRRGPKARTGVLVTVFERDTVVAQVDLSKDEALSVVDQIRGIVAWLEE